MKYIFGPVPSRRLGNILGLDIIPKKTCNFDCVYCELGNTVRFTEIRGHFDNADDIINETIGFIKSFRGNIDYIAFTGSGEPTLNKDIGYIASRLKERTKTPLALVTNSSMLRYPDVRADIMVFDVILPSIDAFDEDMFRKINKPSDNIKFNDIVEGLKIFSHEFKGMIYLEIMFVKGINDSNINILELRKILNDIRIDKIQINTVTRKPAYPGVMPINDDDKDRIKNLIGDLADVEGVFLSDVSNEIVDIQKVIELISKRPLTFESISSELNIAMDDLLNIMNELQKRRIIMADKLNDEFYYSIRGIHG